MDKKKIPALNDNVAVSGHFLDTLILPHAGGFYGI